ncbi:hypothetical protein KY290_033606 [Solanum tuberosum]|uniref:Uncharacterized protein n=1 Tax=Solanum tuberosum TaxID=4113 RepID=A0ABQ7U1C0_SOLTU|nr:hypothetical protein KY289_032975 [Solanum tuberosum]KAH0647616.1 hypothetical protein KY285_032864 [Solanum tuberosum]KAH0740563.1 hypothetical protein KY290_033606 [Solanum tuberosum]
MYPIERYLGTLKSYARIRACPKENILLKSKDHMHFNSFSELFKKQEKELEVISDILQNIKALAKGPSYIAKRFNTYDVYNGYRFRTKQS